MHEMTNPQELVNMCVQDTQVTDDDGAYHGAPQVRRDEYVVCAWVCRNRCAICTVCKTGTIENGASHRYFEKCQK